MAKILAWFCPLPKDTVFEDEKLKASDEKSVKRKIA